MKFAKYQANNLIPEWRLKYLDVTHPSLQLLTVTVQEGEETFESGEEST